MAYDEISQSIADQLPILVIKCKDCGNVYFAHALAYPIDEDSAFLIANAVRNGDTPHICTEIILGCCECDKPFLEEDEED